MLLKHLSSASRMSFLSILYRKCWVFFVLFKINVLVNSLIKQTNWNILKNKTNCKTILTCHYLNEFSSHDGVCMWGSAYVYTFMRCMQKFLALFVLQTRDWIYSKLLHTFYKRSCWKKVLSKIENFSASPFTHKLFSLRFGIYWMTIYYKKYKRNNCAFTS